MNTPFHAVINPAILGRKSRLEWNWSIVLEALIPDLAISVLYGWARAIASTTMIS